MSKPNTAIVYCNGVEQKRESIHGNPHTHKERMAMLRRLYESVRKVAERNPHDTYYIELTHN